MVGLDLEWEFRERAFAFLRAVQLRTGGPVGPVQAERMMSPTLLFSA